jgi:hypothetical protein
MRRRTAIDRSVMHGRLDWDAAYLNETDKYGVGGERNAELPWDDADVSDVPEVRHAHPVEVYPGEKLSRRSVSTKGNAGV